MQPDSPEKKKPSPLAYVGCGCAVLTVVGVIAVVAFFLFAGHQVEQFQTDMASVQLKTREVVSRGVLELPGRKLRYLTQRGELISSEHGRPGPVLSALVLFDCPGPSTLRMGLWTAPDPAPQTPLRKLDTTGTPVDVEALNAFMAHLNPCLVK